MTTKSVTVPKDIRGYSLHKKLAWIHENCVGYLQKENAGYNFKYVSSSQAITAVRELMCNAGVLLLQSMTDVEFEKEHTTRKGGTEYFTEAWFDMTWVNADDKTDRETVKWYAQGLDDGEKGPGKAATYAEKFFILKSFNIATDKSDPDANQRPQDDIDQRPSATATAAPMPSSPSRSRPDSHNQSPISEKQGKLIYAKCKAKGMSVEAMHDIVEQVCGVQHSKEIQRQQMDDLLEAIEDWTPPTQQNAVQEAIEEEPPF